MIPGERIGRFQVLSELGAGGMGRLLRARDPRLGREVAIKLVAERLAQSPEHLARFEREARAASALNHPNIVTIYEIGEHEGFPFLAMELVDGESLRSVLSEEERPVGRVVALAAELAEGLAAAHEAGIVHRDLKPENIMVTRRGGVKILDFGLAKLVSRPLEAEHTTAEAEIATRSGSVVGTVGYMSPEQARGLGVDHRSDQFAFGTILYEMLTGERPFRGATPLDTLSAILHHEPEDPSRRNPRIPGALGAIVRRCLAKAPEARWATTRELARALAAVRDEVDRSGGGRAAPVFGRLRSGRGRAAALAAAVLLLAGSAGIVWLLGDRSATGAPGQAAAAVRRVAVLPFRDLSGRPAGALIGEGFAETVSARLGADAGLAVLPAPAVDEAAGDLAALARRTGAEVLLRGSLQFEGERVRATFAVLAADGRQLAAGAAEGSAARLFDLQDEVARRAAAALGGGTPALPAVAEEDVAGDRYLEALGHLRRYENEASVDAAIRILEELGGSAPVQAALARAYLAKRTLTADRVWAERALEAGRRAAELAPDLGPVRETRGRLELLLGRPAEAAAEFRQALALQPNAVEAHLGLASALERQGLAAEAEAAYRRAIQIQPGWWATHSHLGVFQLLRGELAAAIESFRAAVRLSPDNTRALANLGAALQQAGRHEEAIAEYERSIAIRPTASALSNLGTCLFSLGRYGEAVPAYERALALQPERGVLWLNLGDALRWADPDGREAASAYRRAIELLAADVAVTPRDADARTGLALALAHSGEHARARSEADAALAADPEGAYTLYQVALVRLAAGEDEAGWELLARAAANGYPVSEMARDPELARLKSDPRFGRMRASHPGP